MHQHSVDHPLDPTVLTEPVSERPSRLTRLMIFSGLSIASWGIVIGALYLLL